MAPQVPSIGEAVDFIIEARAGQVTKAGEPYWTHPVAVLT